MALSGAASYTHIAGYISVCKTHDLNGFCGVCFKDENVLRSEPPDYQSTLSPVDDFDTWFGNVSQTCEKCRTVATRQAMKRNGLNNLMARQTDMDELFANYQTYGEGSLYNLCIQVHERKWLLANTKIKDYSFQAVAGDRLLRGLSMAEAAYSDTEDLAVLYTEPSIRELATRDFVRNLILSGSWFSPLDVIDLQQPQNMHRLPYWHAGQPTTFPVMHPTSGESKLVHWFYHVPSADLRELLQLLWNQCMVDMLETVFKNIIAEVSDGCLVDSKVWEFDKGESAPGAISDPGTQLMQWNLVDVWERLLKLEYWVTGYNWRSRKLEEHRERRISDASARSQSSSTSSESTNQSESPTGTASTLQTTPSPPPATTSKDGKSPERASNASVAHVSKTPDTSEVQVADLPDIELTGVEARAVQSIPFVPMSYESLGQHSLRWIWGLWLKSIHPFVTCQCRICKRACQMQEEERLRGVSRKAPTGGIVINEPVSRKKEDELEDEDVADELETSDVFDESSDAMDIEAGNDNHIAIPEDPREKDTTPVQFVQHPATPPNVSSPDMDSTASTPGTTKTLLSRISARSTTPIGSLSPPTCRKRASQELESMPSSPASAKRRRLDSGDSKLGSPSPVRSPPFSVTHSRAGDTPSSSGPDSVLHMSPESLQDTNGPLPQSSTVMAVGSTLNPVGFEEGVAASNRSAGIGLLEFAIDDMDAAEKDERSNQPVTVTNASNESIHWD